MIFRFGQWLLRLRRLVFTAWDGLCQVQICQTFLYSCSQVRWLHRSLRSFSETAFIQLPDPESVIALCEASMPHWPEMDGSAPGFQWFSKIGHLHSEQRQPNSFLWIEQLLFGSVLQSPCKLTVDSGFEMLRQSASFHFLKLLDNCIASEPQVTCPCVF